MRSSACSPICWHEVEMSTTADLGDATIDDGTAGRARDEHDFALTAKRWLRPEMAVLEVGPGDGRWTIRIAPLVRTLIVVDGAEEILQRTRERCESLGIHNVEYVLASGRDIAQVPDQGVDLYFTHNALVHTAVGDAVPYASEIVRVLKPGAISVSCYHFGEKPEWSGRTDTHDDRHRDRADTLGRHSCVGPEMLTRLYEHVGLRVFELDQEETRCTVVATRTADSMVVPLEQALAAALAAAAGSSDRIQAVASIDALVDDLRARLRAPLQRLTEAPAGEPIAVAAQEIRRVWRGE
jgi:SAM-dependent methyltransferase